MRKHLPRMINFILAVLMLLIVAFCMFGTGAGYAYKKEFALPNVVYAILGVAGFALVGLISYKLGAWLEKSRHSNLIMLLLSGVFFCLLVVLTYHYYFKTGWDAQKVEWAAKAIAERDWEGVQSKYFSYYPNNIFLTYIFGLVCRFGMWLGINNYYFSMIIFQCALFALTGFVLYRSACMCANVRVGLSVWIMYILLVGLSPWVVVPYSDATGLLFPTLLFYLYLRMRCGKQIRLSLFLFVLLSYLGYHIKPQTVIVAIAAFLVTVFSFEKEWLRDVRRLAVGAAVGLAGMVLGIVVVNFAVKATHLEVDPGLQFGMIHFLNMGLNEEYGGVINIVDQDFSMSFSTTEERNAANLQVAKERLQQLGVGGLLRLWKNKTLTNFADGTFAWWQEGGFYDQEMYEGNYQLRALLTDYYYEGRSNHELFKSIMQSLWMGTLFLSLAGTICFVKQSEKSGTDVLKLSLIGIILFEMIFEARARYLFIYAPLFILWAYSGWKKYVK